MDAKLPWSVEGHELMVTNCSCCGQALERG